MKIALRTLVCCWLALALTQARAVTTEERTYHGRTILCFKSGLRGFGDPCGTEDHEMVFIGKIVTVKPVYSMEMSLVLEPQEVFKGAPGKTVTVRTNQGPCMPELKAGDSWLFYISRAVKRKGYLLEYFNRFGGPVEQQQAEIKRLRRLATLKGEGLALGRVTQPSNRKDTPAVAAANHTVTMTQLDSGAVSEVQTDGDGNFAFAPLPAGRYRLDPHPEAGQWTIGKGETQVTAQGCMNYSIHLNEGTRPAWLK